MLADRITIDLAGHTITGPGGGGTAAIFDNNGAWIGTVVRNGSIRNFDAHNTFGPVGPPV